MKRSSFKSFLLMVLLISVAVLVLAGCGSSNSAQSDQMPADLVAKYGIDKPSQSQQPAGQAQTQQQPADKPMQPPASQTPAQQTAAPASNSLQAPSAHPTVAQVMAGVASSHYLDKTHLDKGLTCDSCHGKVTAGQPVTPPNDQKCLSCHGGSYQANAAKTASIGQYNPHASPHDDLKSCANCHHSHKPSEWACITCHDRSPGPILKKYMN